MIGNPNRERGGGEGGQANWEQFRLLQTQLCSKRTLQQQYSQYRQVKSWRNYENQLSHFRWCKKSELCKSFLDFYKKNRFPKYDNKRCQGSWVHEFVWNWFNFIFFPSESFPHSRPSQERPFTHNVILMMAPSVRAVITLGLFYCPNHKLSTPQFIKLD